MRTLPLLLAAGLLATACETAVDGDDPAVRDAAEAPELGTEPTAEPVTDDDEALPRAPGLELDEACTITTDGAPAGDVRLAFPAGWLVGECGLFDPAQEVLDDDGTPEGIDIQWLVDPVWFVTATELAADHDRFAATVSGLPALRMEGTLPDDHDSSPGQAFTTWLVDLSAGLEEEGSVLVGTVVDGDDVDYDLARDVLDRMATSLAAQNPYEDVDDETGAIALRTVVDGAQATVTFDEGDCVTLRAGGVAGEPRSSACGLDLPDGEAVTAVRLPWDEDTVVVAGLAHPDVDLVRITTEVDGEDVVRGAIPVANDDGPDAFATMPLDEDEVGTFEAVGADDVVITEFEAAEAQD